jgi:hypothetical protein
VLNVLDQRESNVIHRYRGVDEGTQRFELRAGPEATALKVTFAVIHPVVVEVTGQATLLRTNVARWAK